jgi:prophage DNA circulation protein
MSQQKVDSFTVGLSEAEKDDLEKMLGEFRRESPMDVPSAEKASVRSQLDRITHRLADLTEKVLHLDRQMAPLMEIIRLSHQKSELLSQRLDAVIAALKKGRMI